MCDFMYKGLFIVSFFWVLGDLYYRYKYIIKRYKCKPKNGMCKNFMCKHSNNCYYYFCNDCLVHDLDDTKFIFYVPEHEKEYRYSQKISRKDSRMNRN